MQNINQTHKFKVSFNRPEFNSVYEFVRHESGAFQYGNQSGVTIYKNGKFHATYDTRYDKLVMKDFHRWCTQMLRDMFNQDYEPQWEEIEE